MHVEDVMALLVGNGQILRVDLPMMGNLANDHIVVSKYRQ